MLAHIDGPQPVKSQIIKGVPHRRGEVRRIRALELKSQPQPAAHYQQIKLRTGVHGPKEALLGPGTEALYRLLRSEALPRSANLWVQLQLFGVTNIKQQVEQPRVVEIYLRRFDLAFGKILVPGLQ
jgi:hypothetical protein